MTAEAAEFSVTVPTSLPVTVDNKGNHTSASDLAIKNNSHGLIKVSNVTITGKNGWSIVDNTTDMTKEKVNAKKLGIELGVQGKTLDNSGAGTFNFQTANWESISGKALASPTPVEQKLEYKTKAPAQSTALTNVNVADIVFTIGWDTEVVG